MFTRRQRTKARRYLNKNPVPVWLWHEAIDNQLSPHTSKAPALFLSDSNWEFELNVFCICCSSHPESIKVFCGILSYSILQFMFFFWNLTQIPLSVAYSNIQKKKKCSFFRLHAFFVVFLFSFLLWFLTHEFFHVWVRVVFVSYAGELAHSVRHVFAELDLLLLCQLHSLSTEFERVNFELEKADLHVC